MNVGRVYIWVNSLNKQSLYKQDTDAIVIVRVPARYTSCIQ